MTPLGAVLLGALVIFGVLILRLTSALRELAELVRFLIYGVQQKEVAMTSYLPSRKVLAAALLAVVGTVFLVASGDATLATLGAVWAPVAAAYGIAEK